MINVNDYKELATELTEWWISVGIPLFVVLIILELSYRLYLYFSERENDDTTAEFYQ